MERRVVAGGSSVEHRGLIFSMNSCREANVLSPNLKGRLVSACSRPASAVGAPPGVAETFAVFCCAGDVPLWLHEIRMSMAQVAAASVKILMRSSMRGKVLLVLIRYQLLSDGLVPSAAVRPCW
jgi:hypothetical protein